VAPGRTLTAGTTATGGAPPVVVNGPGGATDQPVAVVNGQEISRAELDASLRSSDSALAALPEAQRKQRYIVALGLLIDNKLLHQFLEQYTAPVSPQEVDRLLGEMKDGLRQQGKTLEEFCHDINQSLIQFRNSLADHLRWSKYAESRITDATLEQYYRENKDVFDQAEVHAWHIVLRLPPASTDPDRTKAKEFLQELRRQILEGKIKFAEAAQKYSQDPVAGRGGDLGFIPRRWFFDETFTRAAFALKPGGISDVVETDFGYHLIQVTERKVGTPTDYAKIKEGVREYCMEDMRRQLLDQLRKKAAIRITPP
jgi:peptidyl-prolyl cis-trans isomerase C